MKAPSDKLINDVVGRIVRTVRPRRVILFGSAARKEMGPNSDLDFLVVLPPENDVTRAEEDIYRNLWGVGFAVEVVVITETELPILSANPYLVVHEAVSHGRELYRAAG